MTKMFIDNNWSEYNYQYLHDNHGITRTASESVSYLGNNLEAIVGWKNNDEIWIVRDSRWYADPPYWTQTQRSTTRYRIDDLQTFEIYTKQGVDYVWHENGFYTLDELHDDFGYTETPSSVWDIDACVAWAWYNAEERMYWDDRALRKHWGSEIPKPDNGETIPESPLELIPALAYTDGGVLSINDGFEVYQSQYIDWLKPIIESQDEFITNNYAPLSARLEPDE